MTFKQRYVNPIIIYFLIYLFGLLLFSIGVTVSRYAYAYMNYLIPDVFPMFSPISEKEAYAKYLTLLDTTGIFIGMLLINNLSLRFDNAKFEYMIDKTDGKCTVSEGLRIYFKGLYSSEIISAVIFPLALIIPVYFIPDIQLTEIPIVNMLINSLDLLLWLGNAFIEHYNLTEAIFIGIMLSALSRALVIPSAINRWRGAWLSGSVE